jgi:hypothetical protein
LNGNQRWNVPAVVPLHGVAAETNFQGIDSANGDRNSLAGGNVTSLNVNDEQLVDEQRLFPPMPDAPVKE